MSYNAKNYTEQGGEVTHIGGKLVFDAGSEPLEGLAANVAMSSGTSGSTLRSDLDAVVTALKDAGIMVGDAWNVAVKDHSTITWANMPTAETISNSNHATAAITDNKIVITLDCKVSELADADHGSTWGEHKWFAIGVDPDTGSSVAGVVFQSAATNATLTADDDSEASTVGLAAGDFVLYFKAEKLLAEGGRFSLSGLGKKKTEFIVELKETTT